MAVIENGRITRHHRQQQQGDHQEPPARRNDSSAWWWWWWWGEMMKDIFRDGWMDGWMESRQDKSQISEIGRKKRERERAVCHLAETRPHSVRPKSGREKCVRINQHTTTTTTKLGRKSRFLLPPSHLL